MCYNFSAALHNNDLTKLMYVNSQRVWEEAGQTIFYIFCIFLYLFFGGLECVGHSFAYVAYFLFLRDVWI